MRIIPGACVISNKYLWKATRTVAKAPQLSQRSIAPPAPLHHPPPNPAFTSQPSQPESASLAYFTLVWSSDQYLPHTFSAMRGGDLRFHLTLFQVFHFHLHLFIFIFVGFLPATAPHLFMFIFNTIVTCHISSAACGIR